MNILLIGGTRFLGRYIVKDLASRGHKVTLLNRGSMAVPEEAAGLITCDKNERELFRQALTAERWDAVIDTILQDSDLEFAIDVLGGRVGHFIHTGSIGVYGGSDTFPAVESTPLAEHDAIYNFNPKLRQDQVLMQAHLGKSFPATVLRKSYIYGPGAVLLDGWGGRDPLFFRIMRDGETLPLAREGQALLHPGHVGDLARAFGDSLENPQSIGQIYNIGGFEAWKMSSYVELVAHELGVEPAIEYTSTEEVLSRFPHNTNERGLRFANEHMCCSITKAADDMGWMPRMPLASGIRENLAWMKQEGLI